MRNVTFILFPGFQMLAYVLATESLRLANKCAGEPLFSWQTRTATNAPVKASSGVVIAPDTTDWSAKPLPDLTLLCAGYDPLASVTPRVRSYLAAMNRQGVTIGGVDTGSVVLAQLGLLDGYQAVLHHEAESGFRETWPDIDLSDGIYCLDQKRLTAAGGTATADAMLAWLAREISEDFADATSDTMSHGRIRHGHESQKRTSSDDPLLTRMRRLMKRHLADPLPITALCDALSTNPKHLRTRCKRSFGLTVQEFYLQTRLDQASHLLRNTHMPITEIALATGFASLSSFSRAFSHRFETAPRSYRQVANAATSHTSQ